MEISEYFQFLNYEVSSTNKRKNSPFSSKKDVEKSGIRNSFFLCVLRAPLFLRLSSCEYTVLNSSFECQDFLHKKLSVLFEKYNNCLRRRLSRIFKIAAYNSKIIFFSTNNTQNYYLLDISRDEDKKEKIRSLKGSKWSGRWDLNPRPSAWQSSQ